MDVYILGGLRSHIGVSGGMYRHIPAEILGARVLEKVMEKYDIEKPDFIIAGNAVGAGGNIARLAALEAGADPYVPAFTIDAQCGSGLESIAVAAAKIAAGDADVIIAGGFESSSTQPRRGYSTNHPDFREGDYSVAKFMPGIHRETVMLEGAELAAKEENITRDEMDTWVLKSHRLAAEAAAEGILKDRIVPVCGGTKDEGIRPKMDRRLLTRVKPVLPGGVITAANACLTNDGAAFLVLCSGNYLRKRQFKGEARISGYAATGGNPLLSPGTAVPALEKLLGKLGLQESDIDAFEVNEAFAVIDVIFARAFPESIGKYNIFGGALAYGHPYGASGGIIMLHLLENLKRTGGLRGCCSIAAAGGVGTAMAVERI